jgi:hypothetical protein
MRRIKSASLGVLFLVAVVFAGGCATTGGPSKLQREQQSVAKHTPAFDPSYFKEPQRKHLAVFFDVREGELAPSKRAAQVRPGRMPHRSETAGNVIVVYRGVDGKELGRYAVEDPALARSCDFDRSRTGAVKPIPKGTVEILLPYDPRIGTVEISRVGGKPRSFDIRPQIAEGLREQK